MLEAGILLKTLNSNDNKTEDYKSRNDDYDLGEVLSYFSDGVTKHKLRYFDGTESYFSFKI